ncbi:MAG: phosphoglycerate kinase [Archaeoglobaceae archaeon]|nr:phosphoglycerate kinase [Archaeoglobaceae archaeon]MDW8117384.1 phosphoglycerate kinase [Archaeoglobaceae archaeon]
MTELPTLDDIDSKQKSVLLRLDINAPIVNSTILDTTRFESHLPTLRELEDKRMVILAHQSRPGRRDFTTLEEHAKVLSKIVGREVDYIDEIFSRRVLERIRNMKSGEVVLLENVRFYSEEQLDRTAEDHANSLMVKRLKDNFDAFVNDAFSAFHRSHASLVGFIPVLPTFIGRVAEKEINALSRGLRKGERIAFVLGGAKIKDPIKVMKNVLENGIAERVFLTGVIANYFLHLKGKEIGEENRKIVEDNKENVKDEDAKKLLEKHKDKILLPIDFGIEVGGVREDVSLEDFKGKGIIKDIGVETMNEFSKMIPEFDTVVVNGTAGVYEDTKFSIGTYEVLKAVSKVKFSIVGGGHSASAVNMFGLGDKVSHVSIAGGACVRFLSGEKLPVIEKIMEYWGKNKK